jgi:hypothetical protein
MDTDSDTWILIHKWSYACTYSKSSMDMDTNNMSIEEKVMGLFWIYTRLYVIAMFDYANSSIDE